MIIGLTRDVDKRRSVADALKLGHTVDPENYASATVAFSDIVGFTGMAAMSNPLQVLSSRSHES